MKTKQSRISVTPYARYLGLELIQNLHIRRGKGIAEYLGVEHFYTNYEAVYLWIDRMLEYSDKELSYSKIRDEFIRAMPYECRGETS